MPVRTSGGAPASSAASIPVSRRAVVPTPRAAAERSVRILLACFFLSGAAALTYQVAWTKSLGLLFGYSAYALGTVLAAFMGGLALGSAWLGKRADNFADPIRMYGWLELAIAGSGALSLAGLVMVRTLYLNAYPLASISKFGLQSLRFVGASLVLLLPTILMGATFPTLIRGVTRTAGELGVSLGRFYAVNSFGAVMGTLAAGFVLLPFVGLRLTIAGAALLNVVAGAMAFQASMPVPAPPEAGSPEKRSKGPEGAGLSREALLGCFALVGATAIAYEIGWTRLLATWLGSSTYAFSVILATFLAGLSIGSYAFELWVAKGRRVTLATFAMTQLATAAAAVLFFLFFRELPAVVIATLRTNRSFNGLALAQFFASALTLLPAAIAFGFNFPAVTLLINNSRSRATKQSEQIAEATGHAYAANTSGAVLAAVACGFFLLPAIGSFRMAAAAAALNAGLGLFLLVLSASRYRWRGVAAGAGLLAAIGYCAASSRFYDKALASFGAALYGDYHGSNLSLDEIADTEDIVFLEDGISATIAVARSDDYIALKTNGKVDASTVDISTQLLLGDLGAILHPRPRRVLIIGLGGGMTASAVARFPDVERIDCVEIEPGVVHAAKYLERLSRGVLSDPRFHLVVDDARNFIQTNRQLYDLIISEPSNPWIAGVGSLYTDEFYVAIRQHLAPAGIFVQWVQAYGLEPAAFRMITATLVPHFADVSLWRSAERDFLLLARTNTEPLSFERARRLWLNAALAEDFRALHLVRPESWPAYFRLSDPEVRALAGGSALNTDDRTALEYEASRSFLNGDLTGLLDAVVERGRNGLLPAEVAREEYPSALLGSSETAVEIRSSRAGMLVSALAAKPTGSGASREEIELLRGRAALSEGHVNQALDLFDAMNTESSSNHYTIGYWLGLAEHAAGSSTQAQTRIDDYLQAHPDDFDALRLRVQMAREGRDWPTAIRLQQRVVTASKQATGADFCILGDLFLRNADVHSAEGPLRRGLELEPYSFLCHRDLGELQRAAGALAEAEKNLEFVVRYFPEGDSKTYISLALVYHAEGRDSAARWVIRKGKRIFPDDQLLAGFQLG